MFMTSSQFNDIIDILIEDWFPYHDWYVILAKAKLTVFIVTPGVHLAKLIYSKGV